MHRTIRKRQVAIEGKKTAITAEDAEDPEDAEDH